MNILTDEEVDIIVQNHRGSSYDNLARAIEAAILKKMVGQEVEPVATVVISTTGMFAGIKRNLVLHQDAPILFDGDKLCTETQLLAAQQRTAEACALYCGQTLSPTKPIGDRPHRAWIEGTLHCADAIREGKWREYL